MLAATTEKALHVPEAALLIEQLRKSFGSKEVLHGVNLDVRSGEMFGIVGPDGAGKTTIMQVLSGTSPFGSGSVRVLGKSAREARPQISYLTQQFSLYPDLSVGENIRYIAGLHSVPSNKLQERKARLLKKVGLAQFEDRLASALSGGMRQKLALCCALISEPHLLLLDEPTVGVDPVSRLEFWELLDDVKKDGVSIIVATPYCEEGDRCDRVALLSEGVIEVCGAPSKLKEQLKLDRVQLYTNDNRRAVLILHKDAQEDKVAGIVDTYELGDHLDALLRWSADSEEALRHLLSEEQIEISRIEVELPTIENVFLLHAMKQGVQDAAVTDLTALRRDKATRKSGTAVRAENLGRKFASFQAVKSLNLKVKYGEIYGLLGANGAGKTTTIKILCGLINASSGKVQLAEESEDLRNSELRKRTGYMSQKSTLYADLTVRENLEFYNSVYKVPNDRRGDMVEWALSNCGLTGRGEELISNLPKGLTQRVAFAAAVMHTPDILFLDEPSSGVDPAARRQLWHMIRALAEDGTAVIVTTHGLDEAEYCNRLGIMSGGELLVEGTPSELRESEQSDTLEEAFIKLVGRRGGR